jgi:hypothetical protein
MPHGRLRDSGCNPAFAQQSAEAVTQGVNVDSASAFVAFVNPPLAVNLDAASEASGNQVAVENLYQPGRHVEQGGIGWKPCGNRLTLASSFALEPFQLVGQPFPQICGQVIPDGDIGAVAVLFVGGMEFGEGTSSSKCN